MTVPCKKSALTTRLAVRWWQEVAKREKGEPKERAVPFVSGAAGGEPI